MFHILVEMEKIVMKIVIIRVIIILLLYKTHSDRFVVEVKVRKT